jgi:hypothetical protein
MRIQSIADLFQSVLAEYCPAIFRSNRGDEPNEPDGHEKQERKIRIPLFRCAYVAVLISPSAGLQT